MFRALRNWYLGGTQEFYAYEQVCLDRVKQSLLPEPLRILEAQLARIKVIQRSPNAKISSIFYTKNKTGMPLFPNTTEELEFAKCKITSDGEIVTCRVVSHRGWLASLEFNRSPKIFQKCSSISCKDISILADLMAVPQSVAYHDAPATGGILENICVVSRPREIKQPVDGNQRSRFLTSVDAALPSDYVALLSETDGFHIDDWEFLGTHIRRYPADDASYVYLAESSAYALAVKEGGDGRVYLHDEVNDELIDLGASFVAAFERVLREGTEKIGEAADGTAS